MKRLFVLLLFVCIVDQLNSAELYTQELKPYPVFINVPVTTGNDTLVMVFDTGASQIVIEKAAGSSITPTIDKVPVNDANGNSTLLEKGSCPKMMLGGFKLMNECLLAPQFNSFRLLTGVPIKGFLGMSSFQSSIIQLNYDDRIFAIADTLPPLRGFQSVALKKGQGCPEVTMKIDGREFECLIDTGFNHAFNLNAAIFDECVKSGVIQRTDKAKGGSIAVNQSLANDMTVTSGWFTRGEFMGRSLRGAQVTSTRNSGASAGLLWLVRFNIVIDMLKEKIYYQDRKLNAPINVTGTLGAVFIFENGQMNVAQLKPGGSGAAEQAGLKLGDVISTFCGLPTDKLNLLKIEELVEKANDQIECEVRSIGSTNNHKVTIKFGAKKLVDNNLLE